MPSVPAIPNTRKIRVRAPPWKRSLNVSTLFRGSPFFSHGRLAFVRDHAIGGEKYAAPETVADESIGQALIADEGGEITECRCGHDQVQRRYHRYEDSSQPNRAHRLGIIDIAGEAAIIVLFFRGRFRMTESDGMTTLD